MMKQTLNKKSVDEMLDDLPRNEREIVSRLRSLILECLPFATEKNNYGAPFYTHNRMICYLWPPSLKWGSNRYLNADKGVSMGFCYGKLMANDQGLLLSEGRKQVYVMYFKSIKEIDEKQIRALLFEAGMIDQQFKRGNKGRGYNDYSL